MGKSTTSDAQALIRSLCSAYSATPTNLKIVDLYVIFAVFTAAVQLYGKGDEARDRLGSVSCFRLSVHTMPLTVRFKLQKPDDANILHREPTRPLFSSRQVIYIGIVGTFPFNSFLSGALSCAGTAVFAVCLRIQVNKENKEFKDLPPERAFADFVLCNLVLHLVITNFLG